MRTAYMLLGVVALATGALLGPPASAGQKPDTTGREDRGAVELDAIDEASGMVVSYRNPGLLWTHNDSGDAARLYAMDTSGKHLGTIRLADCVARDWEDIAIGPGPAVDGKPTWYLYAGDIGDNRAKRPVIQVQRLPEPDVSSLPRPFDLTLSADTIVLRYPDGSRDAESLMVDPNTQDIYIVSKREGEVRLYRAPSPHGLEEPNVLEFLYELPFSSAVAADVSNDGLHVVVKTYTAIHLWHAKANEDIAASLRRPFTLVPYIPEIQGEALAWSTTESGYYTLSEETMRLPAHLFFYPFNCSPEDHE